MSIRLYVPEELREKVSQFVQVTAPELEVVDAEPCDICVEVSAEKAESRGDTLAADGWITCPTALAMSKKHQLCTETLGALVDLLHIKVRECSLGCFR